MCIIVAVPAGVDIPNDTTLKECFVSNPDGAGFMWSDGKQVHIRKGFMKWEDFKKALDAELDAGRIYTDSAVVLHFRITTSGKTQPACCHPFPISDKKKELQATSIESRWGIAHNGVIQGRTTYDGWSDTMDFIACVVAPLSRMHPSFMYSDDANELLKGACKSKLAIINHAGEMMLVGEFTEDDGVFYSNTSYLPTRYNWSSYTSTWSKAYDSYFENSSYGNIDKLISQLEYQACQVCPNAYDCAEYMEWCGSEYEAVATCADAYACTEEEIYELLDWPVEQKEEEVWAKVYDLD